VKKIHVLTAGEIEKYSDFFGVPKERFNFIPWPLHFDQQMSGDFPKSNDHESNHVKISNYVMTSGRANVDWETIFEVAEKSDWPFVAVCNSLNLERVNRLNKNNRAIVLHDISAEEHGKYLKGATVYALCVSETNTGVGHIRLMNTIEHGVPVVASNVIGLEGYAVDGINSILVPPGDVNALKKAIDTLMNDAELRSQLVLSAGNFQQDRTFTNYIAEIKKYINNAVSADISEAAMIMA
jgi:glycosyltransferase involved in cell wall biosynthesis